MGETSESFKLNFSDADYITEFPAIMKCAIECVNGLVTGIDIDGASEYSGHVGCCQVYKGVMGFFIVFFADDLTIITTPQGIYNHTIMFHAIRSDFSLFVFEEDYSRYEEAFCIMSDIETGISRLRKCRALEQIFSSFHKSIEED